MSSEYVLIIVVLVGVNGFLTRIRTHCLDGLFVQIFDPLGRLKALSFCFKESCFVPEPFLLKSFS